MATRKLSPIEIGERLRLAREAAGITQAEAASSADIARTTLVAVEKGQRSAKIKELQKLAKSYNISTNSLLRLEAIQVELLPQFRKMSKCVEDASIDAAVLLQNLVKAEVELESLLGISKEANYPPERRLLTGNIILQAENNAAELRHWLGLGESPIRDIVTLMEMELGIRVYIRKLDSNVSGLFAFDPQVGACILLNASHPIERRNQSAGHELGHFMSTRNSPEILFENEKSLPREERYANAFGRAFLTPTRAVTKHFKDVTAGANSLTRRHVITLAHIFNVSREAIVRRLEELELTKKGTWDWFSANGGITNDQAAQVLGDLAQVDQQKLESKLPTTLKLSRLATEAWKQEIFSEGQLAKLLYLSRHEIRLMLDESQSGGSENGVPKSFS